MRVRPAVAAAALAAGLTSSAPAVAASIDRLALAGPAFAGQSVVWGEERAGGSAAVLRWTPGAGAPSLLHRTRDPRRRRRELGFTGLPGALSASSQRIAWSAMDATSRQVLSDVVMVRARFQALGTRLASPVAALAPRCVVRGNLTTAVDGDTVALAMGHARCEGGPAERRVVLIDGDAVPRTVFAGAADRSIEQVRVAGPRVAWLEDWTRIVVAERATGRITARLRARDLGGRDRIDGFDLDADGTIVAATGPWRACRTSCVRWLRLGARRHGLVARRGSGAVALDQGLVAYVRDRIVVRRLGGGVVARLGRFGPAHSPAGDLALDGGRIAWSVAHHPDGAFRGVPGTLHVRALEGAAARRR